MLWATLLGRCFPWWHYQMQTFSVLLALCVWRIHRPLVYSFNKSQWLGALMFSLICARTNGSANNRDTDDLRRHRAYYDVTVMCGQRTWVFPPCEKNRQSVICYMRLPRASSFFLALRWRNNKRGGISNHRRFDYLLNRLFRRRSTKHQSSASLDLCGGGGDNPSVTGGSHRNGSVTRILFSLWWRHHGKGIRTELAGSIFLPTTSKTISIL